MKIWLDADAAPRAAKEILVRSSVRREVDMVFVANGWLEKPKATRIEVVLVAPGADVADDHIAENIEAGDLCITSDIPLAARAIERGATVLTSYGRELTEEEVGEALSIRDFHEELRDAGVKTGGPPPYNDGAKQKFANALDRWITKNK